MVSMKQMLKLPQVKVELLTPALEEVTSINMATQALLVLNWLRKFMVDENVSLEESTEKVSLPQPWRWETDSSALSTAPHRYPSTSALVGSLQLSPALYCSPSSLPSLSISHASLLAFSLLRLLALFALLSFLLFSSSPLSRLPPTRVRFFVIFRLVIWARAVPAPLPAFVVGRSAAAPVPGSVLAAAAPTASTDSR